MIDGRFDQHFLEIFATGPAASRDGAEGVGPASLGPAPLRDLAKAVPGTGLLARVLGRIGFPG
jgi:hypothetical protein